MRAFQNSLANSQTAIAIDLVEDGLPFTVVLKGHKRAQENGARREFLMLKTIIPFGER